MNQTFARQIRLAGGVLSHFPEGSFVLKGRGGKVYDNFGRAYIDLSMGYGAVSIGHGESKIVEAVRSQSVRGTLMPGITKEETRVRNLLQELFPHTQGASLHKTGSEAVAAAIRIARTVTGRQMIIRCGFHGWHDEMIQSSRRWHADHPPSKLVSGRISGVRDGSAPLEWIDANPATLASIISAHSLEIAAVFLDPVQIQEPIGENLAAISKLCQKSKVLFILDELKTCPRVAMGGVQETYGFSADLSIVGKGLANGFAFAAVLGPDWMAEVCRKSRIMGTFNGELSAFAALSATVKILQSENAPNRLAELGEFLISRTNELLHKKTLISRATVTPGPWQCMPRIKLTPATDCEENVGRFAAEFGACILYPHMNFICLRHRIGDLHRAAEAIVSAVERS